MNNPKEYAANRRRQERDNMQCLRENVHKIKWKGRDRIIDIGSGDGGFTAMILKVFLPDDYEELVGVDRSSEMVMYAKTLYSDERVSFEVLDIREDLPQQLVGYFDHVFSFYTLHWVSDQKKAFANIFSLLSEGGDCLLSILGDIPAYFSVNQFFARSNKWIPWVKDLEHVVSPYHGHPDPEPLLRKMLKATGFKQVDVSRKKYYYTYNSIEEFKSCVKSVTAFKIPSEMMEDYLEEYVTSYHRTG
ncbi:juvenile hormone acid O-methyltransferase-like [Aricia agestis]|uniref:juvenile hormone acid O-methyltransferase-like n=1 Tax=Aricia agestis TaxID=91739 RepID=UPI001C209D8A|nr:juvenile hormone acid O-methyltransferase-like [Aricia agestis]